MELETGDKRIADPSADDLLKELRADNEFVILGTAPGEYVQAADRLIEYRENDRQFRARGTPIDAAVIERVFLAYLAGDRTWRSLVEWEDVTDELRRSTRWQIWFAAAVVALLAWIAYRVVAR
jgi:hypothetical protein